MGNLIERPITPDGLVGWDKFNQLCLWKVESDGSKIGTFIGDPRGSICPVCNRGWETTSESMADQYRWRDREQWVHQTCFIRYLALKDFDTVFWSICDSGLAFHCLEAIPNEYWGQDDVWGKLRPWYSAKLVEFKASLKIGRRKRVWSIGLTGIYPRTNAAKIFDSEDVTKKFESSSMYVHAWSDDDLKRYLKMIAESLQAAALPATA